MDVKFHITESDDKLLELFLQYWWRKVQNLKRPVEAHAQPIPKGYLNLAGYVNLEQSTEFPDGTSTFSLRFKFEDREDWVLDFQYRDKRFIEKKRTQMGVFLVDMSPDSNLLFTISAYKKRTYEIMIDGIGQMGWLMQRTGSEVQLRRDGNFKVQYSDGVRVYDEKIQCIYVSLKEAGHYVMNVDWASVVTHLQNLSRFLVCEKYQQQLMELDKCGSMKTVMNRWIQKRRIADEDITSSFFTAVIDLTSKLKESTQRFLGLLKEKCFQNLLSTNYDSIVSFLVMIQQLCNLFLKSMARKCRRLT